MADAHGGASDFDNDLSLLTQEPSQKLKED